MKRMRAEKCRDAAFKLMTAFVPCRPLRGQRRPRDQGDRRVDFTSNHGCSVHHSGHRTLWAVRVAFTMICCSAGLSVRSRRANAASTSHGNAVDQRSDCTATCYGRHPALLLKCSLRDLMTTRLAYLMSRGVSQAQCPRCENRPTKVSASAELPPVCSARKRRPRQSGAPYASERCGGIVALAAGASFTLALCFGSSAGTTECVCRSPRRSH